MFENIKKIFKRGASKSSDEKEHNNSLLLAAFIGLFEEVLFWRNIWISITFIGILNVVFLICVHRQLSLFKFVICISMVMLIIDALETWLKYKHRTTFLKRLANHNGTKLKSTVNKFKHWLGRWWREFVDLRETNHTKAFILINFILGTTFILSSYISGYLLMYMMFMCICLSYKIFLPLLKKFKSMQQDLESDFELEGLMPEASDLDIKLLSIEPEYNPITDEKQSLDYWKPEDVPLEEASESSEDSSSIVTSFSMDKMHTLEKDIQTSDSSEDEYIPLDQPQKEQLKSTMQVVEPTNSWSSAAYNAIWNITGTVANLMSTSTEVNKRKRVSSVDSSDGFEMIDKNDLT